jgi:hypothetical protein
MSTLSSTGFDRTEAVQLLEARRQARVIASFAENLAEYVHGYPDRAVEAMAALAEWCDDDAQIAVADENFDAGARTGRTPLVSQPAGGSRFASDPADPAPERD